MAAMAAESSQPLLAEKSYDRDAETLRSDGGSDHGSDSDFDSAEHSPEPQDRSLLKQTEQEEELLRKPTRFDSVTQAFGRKQQGSVGQSETRGRRTQRTLRRTERHNIATGSTELMYEMEEGFKDTSATASTESFEISKKKWQADHSPHTSRRFIAFISGSIVCLFLLLGFWSYRVSQHKQSRVQQSFTNGTHLFGPTTILISLDGFRADFLHRGLTPALSAFIASGVSPKYMLPSFPSVTFPNHYTLVTGLYPESHGIVSNQFWDPELQEEFYYTHTDVSMQSKWWSLAEPLWVTTEDQGLKTAVHMWPGSEAHISDIDPTYLDKYSGSEPLENKVTRMLQWLDMEQSKRPQLIAAYVPNVDADGHLYGPNSTEIRGTIADVDSMLTMLVEGLFDRNLTEIVNLVIVSDHGMATTSNDRLIQLDDLIDLSLVDHIDGWPLRGLRLKNPERDVPILYEQLLSASQKTNNFDVYTLATMPERYHFSNNPRIAPLWVIPKTGWAVVEKVDFDVAEARVTGKQYHPLGLHGYDHEHPLMRAIFVARGPAFPHAPNSRIPVFQNIEVYNIVCDSLGVTPHPNNGTLRLPLQTEGLHSDFDEPADIPADPVDFSAEESSSATVDVSTTLTEPKSPGSTSSALKTSSLPAATEESSVETPADASGDSTPSESDTESKGKWWKFVHDQLEKAKEWAKQFVDSIKNNKPPSDDKKDGQK